MTTQTSQAKVALPEILEAALRSGIAHNNGAGGQYLLCATEAQLLKFAAAIAARAQGAGEAKSIHQIALENIACEKPRFEAASKLDGSGDRMRCYHCGYAWQPDCKPFHAFGCAYVEATAALAAPTIPQATPPVQGDQPTPAGFWLAPMEPDASMVFATAPGAAVTTTYLAMRDSWLARHPAAPQPLA